MYRHILVAALLILGVTSVPAQSADLRAQVVCQSRDGQNRFGVNEVLGWPGLYPPDRLEQSLGLMSQAGMGWVRVNWAWKDIETTQGSFDFAHLDDVARIAAEHHIQVLPILTAVPAWSSTAPADIKAKYGNLSPVDRYRPSNIADWLNYVRTVVKRYDTAALHMNTWEIWNEENGADFWPPTPDPAEYLALLKATYQAIKAIDPTAKVVLGGLANAGFRSDGSNYLQSLYDLDGASYFDVISIHYYSAPANGIAPVQQAIERVRAIMDANGDKAKTLWLTEIGWSDAPNANGGVAIDKNQIASFLKSVYTAPLPADVIFWYNFRNIFANSPDPEHNFGLVKADFSPKPSFDTYQALASPCLTKPKS